MAAASAALALTASASDVRLDRTVPSVVAVANRPVTLSDLAAASDLVFRGQVESLETVLSEPAGPDRTRVPYTLVRYRVHDVIHGIADGSTITLRFIGGIDPRSGLLMMTSATPDFAEGDEDILFVRGNGTSLSPLVGELDGRVRIVEGRAWSETGRPVRGFLDFRPELRPAEALFADDLAERLRGAAAAVAPAGRFKSVRPTDVAFAPDVTPAPPPFDAHAEDPLRAQRRLAAERRLQDAEGVAR
jgi:hypothetical protein